MVVANASRGLGRDGLDQDPYWYKTGVLYELHVRAFCDSDGNGIGDFKGLESKLDYLKDLGVTALWLLPFYPSPLRDDGYDIADYFGVHPHYGTLEDFKSFLKAAHQRGLRVITELVMNHTSDRHPWFERARRAEPGSRWRDFYVWSGTPTKYQGARIIFKDIEGSNWTWDPAAKAYYWHRFFSHQPDLNYDNPEVFDEMVKVLDFWLDLGVDGLRLDAVPYLYEREGTSCENLPETHEALRRLRAHVDAKYGDRMLLAEANQWPEDAVAYFGGGAGDECHMAFHFPLMPRLFMALRLEDRAPIVEILSQTPPIPPTAQWALFLRNHDELTLEMVTDEERDYMYRMYAHVQQARLNLGIRRRLAPLLGNDRKRIELLNALLFSLPGTPVLYYGDEIGMGENIYLGDRDGVRTPMQWSSDKNAGFSRANPQALYLPIIYDPEYHYEAVNVEAQLGNPHSLLWWMRRLLALRKKWRALGEGSCEFLQSGNRSILAYVLRDEEETLLVVANLSRFVQPVALDLSVFKQRVPVELFGRTKFPAITHRPYPLTLGPHSFYWFSLETPTSRSSRPPARASELPALVLASGWTDAFKPRFKAALERLLPDYLRAQHWFGSAGRTLKEVSVVDVIPVPAGEASPGVLLLAQADFVQGEAEVYSLPLAFARGEAGQTLGVRAPHLLLAELWWDGAAQGVLHDGLEDPAFCRALLALSLESGISRGIGGAVHGSCSALGRDLAPGNLPPCRWAGRQRNSSVQFGDELMLKLFRRLDPGVNPELEVGRFLTEKQFANVPAVAGALEYRPAGAESFTIAVLHQFARDGKDAWQLTLGALGRYYDRIGTSHARGEALPRYPRGWRVSAAEESFPGAPEVIGTFLESARLLGRRTAELHVALLDEEIPAFAPEPFTAHFVRGLFQSMRSLATRGLRRLQRELGAIPPGLADLAESVLAREKEIIEHYRVTFQRPLRARRMRIHGDYHLGQVLWTGKDFLIIDFEGQPEAALSERAIKRSPLRDIAGMLCSFRYAAWEGLHQHVDRGSLSPENLPAFEPWAQYWNHAVSAAFTRSYLENLGDARLVPEDPAEIELLLQAYLLNHALLEIGQDLALRPHWLKVPLEIILELSGSH